MSPITDTDKLLIQRDDENFHITAGDLTKFQADQIQGVIESLSDKLEQEIVDRTDGDDELELKVDTYRSYVRSGVDLLFPSIAEGDYAFKLSSVEQSTYINRYKVCLNSIDTSLPQEEQDAAKLDCYYSATAAVYTDLGNSQLLNPGDFKVLATSLPNYKETHTLIVEGTTIDNDVIDWDEVNPNDFISIGRHDENGLSSDTDYGFYKVKKNLSRHLIDNNLVTKIPGLYMLELEYHSGNDLEIFFPTAKYSIRAMTDVKGDLSGDFVNKTGDTMSGTLKFDNAKIELFGSSTSGTAIHFTEPSNQTIYKDSGKLIIKVGGFGGGVDAGVAFNDNGLVNGVAVVDETDETSVVNVGHLNTKFEIVQLDLTKIEDDIAILDQRIDAAIKVLDIVKYKVTNIDAGDNLDLDAWTAQETANVNDGDIKFFDKSLGNVILVPGTEINQRVIISHIDAESRPLYLDGGAINIGDYLEFSCDDGDASDFTYQIVDFDISQSGYYQFDLDFRTKFGVGDLQSDKTYKMKIISSQQALTLDDANTRFVAKTGDTMTGSLLIRSSEDFTFKTNNTTDSNTFRVDNNGTFTISTNDTTHYCALNFNDGTISRQLRLMSTGLYSTSSIEPSFNIYVADNNTPKLTISAASINAHNIPIINAGLASPNNLGDVVTVEYYNTKLIDRFGAGVGISITSDENDVITISSSSTFSVGAASDVDSTNFEDGDIIVYNGVSKRFQRESLSSSIKGRNLMATSESEAEVGGIWTDGTNYFIRTS